MLPWTLLIATHAIAATYAMIFGLFNLIRVPKGDRLHRTIGFIWIGTMYWVSFSSFWIKRLTPGHFSWIHLLSILTICTVTLGLLAAMRGDIKAHRAYMTGSYFGLLGAFVGVVTVPVRLIPQMALHDLGHLILFTTLIGVSAALFIYATAHLIFRAPARKRGRRN